MRPLGLIERGFQLPTPINCLADCLLRGTQVYALSRGEPQYHGTLIWYVVRRCTRYNVAAVLVSAALTKTVVLFTKVGGKYGKGASRPYRTWLSGCHPY